MNKYGLEQAVAGGVGFQQQRDERGVAQEE